MLIPEGLKPLSLLAPAADAGGRTSAIYYDLAGVKKAYIVAHVTQGHADTVALIPKQADDAAGTGTGVLTVAARIETNLDVAAGADYTRRADAVNYTTDAALKNKIVVFEVGAFCMSKRFVGFTTGASNAANITSAMLYVDQGYKG